MAFTQNSINNIARAGGATGQFQYNNGGVFAGSAVFTQASGGTLSITTPGSNSGNILDVYDPSGNHGLYLSNTGAISIGGKINEGSTYPGITLGYGPSGDSPRALFCNGTASQNWEIDNFSGTFRWFQPGAVRMSLDSTGTLGSLVNINASGTITTNTLTVMGNLGQINGVSYSWTYSQGAANSTLINNGSGTLAWGQPRSAIRVVTASGTVALTNADYTVVINKAAGSATAISLPASPATGQFFLIKDGRGDANTNNITITPASGTIDGSSTYVIATNKAAVWLQFDGVNYWVV